VTAINFYVILGLLLTVMVGVAVDILHTAWIARRDDRAAWRRHARMAELVGQKSLSWSEFLSRRLEQQQREFWDDLSSWG